MHLSLQNPSMQNTLEKNAHNHLFCFDDWPQKDWWMIFHDEQLDTLIHTGLSNNPSLHVFWQKMQRLKAQAQEKKSRLFPYLFFNIQDEWIHISKNGLYRAFNPNLDLNGNITDINLSLNYEFDLWGKNKNRFLAAIGKAKASKAKLAQKSLDVSTSIAVSYFAVQSLTKQKKYLDKLLSNAKERIFLAKALQSSGLFSKIPETYPQEDMDEIQEHLAEITKEITFFTTSLQILLGSSPDETLDLRLHFQKTPGQLHLPKFINVNLIARRPDLMAAFWKMEATCHEVLAEKTLYLPTLNLGAFGGVQSLSFSDLLNASSLTASLIPMIKQPVYTAGEIKAKIYGKEAAFQETAAHYNQTLLSAIKDITNNIAFAKAIHEKILCQQDAISSALERYELMYARFLSGLDSRFTTLKNQQIVWEKKLAQVQLQYQLYLAHIKLIKSLGGGYESSHVPNIACGDHNDI